MLEALISTILEEVFHASFAGATQPARSRKGRILKSTAMIALCSAILGFTLWATAAKGVFIPVTFLCGVAGVLCFFLFGVWTNVENARAESVERVADSTMSS